MASNPTNLLTIAGKIGNHQYGSRAGFMADLRRIATDAAEYFGPDSVTAVKAKALGQVRFFLFYCKNDNLIV